MAYRAYSSIKKLLQLKKFKSKKSPITWMLSLSSSRMENWKKQRKFLGSKLLDEYFFRLLEDFARLGLLEMIAFMTEFIDPNRVAATRDEIIDHFYQALQIAAQCNHIFVFMYLIDRIIEDSNGGIFGGILALDWSDSFKTMSLETAQSHKHSEIYEYFMSQDLINQQFASLKKLEI